MAATAATAPPRSGGSRRRQAAGGGGNGRQPLQHQLGARRHAAVLVREPVLLAQLPHGSRDLAQVVPRQRREQVVLDLVIQAACTPI